MLYLVECYEKCLGVLMGCRSSDECKEKVMECFTKCDECDELCMAS